MDVTKTIVSLSTLAAFGYSLARVVKHQRQLADHDRRLRKFDERLTAVEKQAQRARNDLNSARNDLSNAKIRIDRLFWRTSHLAEDYDPLNDPNLSDIERERFERAET